VGAEALRGGRRLLLRGDGGAAPAHGQGGGKRRQAGRAQRGGLQGGERSELFDHAARRVWGSGGRAGGCRRAAGRPNPQQAIVRHPPPPLPLAFSSSAAVSRFMDASRIAWMCTGAEKARSRPPAKGEAPPPHSSPLHVVPQLPLLLLDAPRG
jgi:hypothetical protein